MRLSVSAHAVGLRIACLVLVLQAFWSARASAQLTIEIKDYIAMPVTGLVDGRGQTDVMLARVNSMREEPGGTNRIFINDLNGPLYILDRATRRLTTYLDFNGRDGRPGLFHKLVFEPGFGNGLNGFLFDPDYARNGKRQRPRTSR